MIKRLVILVIMVLILASSANAALFFQDRDRELYLTLDTTENKYFSYNYREANKDTNLYEDQFDFEEDRYYNVYNKRQGFRMEPGYSKPVTKDFREVQVKTFTKPQTKKTYIFGMNMWKK